MWARKCKENIIIHGNSHKIAIYLNLPELKSSWISISLRQEVTRTSVISVWVKKKKKRQISFLQKHLCAQITSYHELLKLRVFGNYLNKECSGWMFRNCLGQLHYLEILTRVSLVSLGLLYAARPLIYFTLWVMCPWPYWGFILVQWSSLLVEFGFVFDLAQNPHRKFWFGFSSRRLVVFQVLCCSNVLWDFFG